MVRLRGFGCGWAGDRAGGAALSEALNITAGMTKRIDTNERTSDKEQRSQRHYAKWTSDTVNHSLTRALLQGKSMAQKPLDGQNVDVL